MLMLYVVYPPGTTKESLELGNAGRMPLCDAKLCSCPNGADFWVLRPSVSLEQHLARRFFVRRPETLGQIDLAQPKGRQRLANLIQKEDGVRVIFSTSADPKDKIADITTIPNSVHA